MRRFQFQPGEVIFTQGDVGGLAYLVFSGKVEITAAADGGRRVLARLGDGEVFGEMGTIDGEPRSATATAIEPTVCIAVDEDELLALLENDPQAAVAFVKALIRRLRETNAALAATRPPQREAFKHSFSKSA